MSEQVTRDPGTVKLERIGAVAQLTLSRTSALNAMTWEMNQQLQDHLNTLAEDPTVRALVIRGDGDKSFAAGTDISQFQGFTGEDGINYERTGNKKNQLLSNFPKPTIAAVNGYAVGGGLLLATCCDLRYATPKSKFGAPMARTLGNCLSMENYQRLVNEFGAMRVKELLFTSRLATAEEVLACGFLTAVIEEDTFYEKVLEIAERISNNAPLTIGATKEALSRLNAHNAASIPGDAFDDVIRKVYGSKDFAEGMTAYLEKRPPVWSGE
jgi:enoyl-CoA hydratase/carnithine racemase